MFEEAGVHVPSKTHQVHYVNVTQAEVLVGMSFSAPPAANPKNAMHVIYTGEKEKVCRLFSTVLLQ